MLKHIHFFCVTILSIIFILLLSINSPSWAVQPQIIHLPEQNSVDIRQGWVYQSIATQNPNQYSVQPNFSQLFNLAQRAPTLYTYRKIVEFPSSLFSHAQTWLALYMPYQHNIRAIRIDGKPIALVNQTTAIQQQYEYRVLPTLIFFKVTQAKTTIDIDVIPHDSMTQQPNIGQNLGQQIHIMTKENANKTWNRDFLIRTLSAGGIFIIGLFMLILSYQRRRVEFYYYIGLFALFVAMRAFFTAPFLYTNISDLDWAIANRVDHILCAMMGVVFIAFIRHLFNNKFSSYIYYATVIMMTLLCILIVVLPTYIFQRIFSLIIVFALSSSGYFLYLFIRSIWLKNKRYPLGHIIGLIAIVIAFIWDTLYYLQVINYTDLIIFITAIYVVYIAVSMSIDYSSYIDMSAKLNQELLTLNNTLDKKVEQRTHELSELNKKLDKQSKIDGLTGIYNRAYLNKQLEYTFNQALIEHQRFSLLMMDIDYFKLYNDYYGHLKGDDLLKKIVQLIASQIPKHSLLARYGGEEFVIILGDVTAEQTQTVAHNICHYIEQIKLEHLGRQTPQYVTLSIGAVSIYAVQHYPNVSSILHLADEQLYQAKNKGRNQVQMFAEQVGESFKS